MTIHGEDRIDNKQCEAVVLSAIKSNRNATVGQLFKLIKGLTETQIFHALECLISKNVITNYKITRESIFTVNITNTVNELSLGGGFNHEQY